MEVIRAFIAIELPESVRAALGQLMANLKAEEHRSVKWADPDGIHLTLKFLGNIAAERIPEITKAVSQAATGVAPFRLELGSPGSFPNTRLPRVVWVGLRGEIPSLHSLQRSIEHALVPLGFPEEQRAFSPHLTLGRVQDRASTSERRRLGERIASLKAEIMIPFEVDSIRLMRSVLTRQGAIYSCLASVALLSGTDGDLVQIDQ